tara:strand:+ start:380 stop:565 length:186 start_codon:yes stop_codon:yes gene_type:complete
MIPYEPTDKERADVLAEIEQAKQDWYKELEAHDKQKQAQDGEAMYKLMYGDYPASMDIYDN